MPKSDFATTCTEGLPLTGDSGKQLGFSECDAWTDYFNRPVTTLEVLGYLHWTGKRLGLAAEKAEDIPKVEFIRDWITQHWFGEMSLDHIPCTVWLEKDVVDKFTRRMKPPPSTSSNSSVLDHCPTNRSGTLPGFAALTGDVVHKADDLQSYFDSATYGYGNQTNYYGAIVFSSVGGQGEPGAAGHWSYSIRLNVSAGTSPITAGPKTRPLDLGLRMGEANSYLDRGFVALQLLLDRYIIGSRNGDASGSALLVANGLTDLSKKELNNTLLVDQLAEPLRWSPQSIEAVPMPVQGVVIDGFYELVALVFPLIFIIGFLYTQKKVVNELITEKESKVRESLKMMGVSSAKIIASWFVTYGFIFAVLCAIFAIVAGIEVFPLSSGGVIFLFFWLWCMSFLAFAWFMHCFFNKSRTGGIVTMIVMLLQWLVYGAQKRNGAEPSETVLLMLLPFPNAAFSAGLGMLAKFEAAKVGATWSNLDWPVNNSTLLVVLAGMAVDVILWMLVGWYLDQVLPKEYGARMPPHFPFLASYWLDRPSHGVELGDVDDPLEGEMPPARCAGNNTVEAVPEAVRARSKASGTIVHTRGLRREFKTPGGTKVAVAGLDITMYEGQVTALLGHNGAGKSTTINMLTGMIAPSAGDASVAGYSVLTDMRDIRRAIGVCPQHDVLWLELTVQEHLSIFARLRGVPASQVAACIDDMLKQVGLTEKAKTRAGSLSGGQKRKLSLCLALMGQPRATFLDEPTSGMDPFSRRSTWNLIRGSRDGRVTVLTTHFMDEADILGDRIAIMAKGELQCCGSSLFLKRRFGIGYRVTCARKIAHGEGEQPRQDHDDKSCTPILDAIRRHVPGAELQTDVGAELSVRLPTSSAGRFSRLFEELDEKKTQLGLEHYGLSMVTMEEVFLCVANGEIDRLDRQTSIGSGKSAIGAGAGSSSAESAVSESASSATSSNGQGNGANAHTRREACVMPRHLASLFMKRARYGRRDFKSIACTVLLPVAMLAFGLWILQRVTDRHMPAVLLSASDEYGIGSAVPYNSTRGAPEDVAPMILADSNHVHTIPESLPDDLDSGFIFGRNYSDGLPVFNDCDPGPRIPGLSKCWREKWICSNIWADLIFVQQLGMDIGCNTDRAGCQRAFDEACDAGAAHCVDLCLKQATNVPRGVCQQQCTLLCGNVTKYKQACDVLVDIPFIGINLTIGFYCPVPCANATNPFACNPGTSCEPPDDHGAASPSSSLNFEMLLYQQGQGTKRQDTRYGAVLTTVNKTVGSTATLLFNTSAVHAVPTFVNLVTTSFKQALNGSGSSIAATNLPMPLARTETLDQLVSAVVNLMSTINIIIAFSWIPAAIVAYIVREREAHHNSKHQQLISGVSLTAYWVANLCWDLCVFTVPLSLSLFFIWAFNITAFLENGAIWATLVVFLGYGVAIAPFSYLMSFLFSKHTTAQVLCLVINFITGLLLMITSYILNAIESTKDVNQSLQWIYRLFPGFCLGNGMLQICTASLTASQGSKFGVDVQLDLLGWDVAGKDVMYLYIAGPIYFVLTLLVDYLAHSPAAAAGKLLDPRGTSTSLSDDSTDIDDEDVHQEVLRVESGAADDDVIRLVKLRKVYRTPEGRPKVAVKGLSFALPRGECFGFLGINGAGKTSTLNMLTGAVLPSSGSAYLGGFDVVKQQWQVRRLLGYCPQHDALLDRLTVREHLELFGRIKGIPRHELRRYCDEMMKSLSLGDHVDKMAMTLSGGNKRKLSLAVSLMGVPPLVLLDEPSTGVDPAARRLMWDIISAVSTTRRECSVMLTTHNMEEAEALCSRIGIMVGGRLSCIGSNQHLKARFGSGYQLEARLRCPGADEVQAFVNRAALPECIEWRELASLCSKLGEAHRAELVREGCEQGHLVYEILSREGGVPASLLAEWWLLEDRANALGAFLESKFPGTVHLEQHERTLRYRLPAGSTLAKIFGHLEASQTKLALEEYGICQTTLEQIFNSFAAQQQEETNPVRGLLAVSDLVGAETGATV